MLAAFSLLSSVLECRRKGQYQIAQTYTVYSPFNFHKSPSPLKLCIAFFLLRLCGIVHHHQLSYDGMYFIGKLLEM